MFSKEKCFRKYHAIKYQYMAKQKETKNKEFMLLTSKSYRPILKERVPHKVKFYLDQVN